VILEKGGRMKIELIGMNGKIICNTETMPLADLSRVVHCSAELPGMLASSLAEWEPLWKELVKEYKRQKELRGPLTAEMAREPSMLPNEFPFDKAPR
jgi:hypothetical protein